AVGEINISVPALEKERPVTRRHPAEGVPRGVADDIRLDLDDAAAGDALGHLSHQYLADEIASETVSTGRSARESGGWPPLCRSGFSASARPIARVKAPAQTDH